MIRAGAGYSKQSQHKPATIYSKFFTLQEDASIHPVSIRLLSAFCINQLDKIMNQIPNTEKGEQK